MNSESNKLRDTQRREHEAAMAAKLADSAKEAVAKLEALRAEDVSRANEERVQLMAENQRLVATAEEKTAQALRQLDVAALERAVGQWLQRVRAAWLQSTVRWLDGIAIDGAPGAGLPGVTPENAVRITAVYRAVSLIASISRLPLHVYERDGVRRREVTDVRERVIWGRPNPEVSSSGLRRAIHHDRVPAPRFADEKSVLHPFHPCFHACFCPGEN